MQEIYRVIARLMDTDLTVLIDGESGTGKELVARALHDFRQAQAAGRSSPSTWRRSPRADRERAVRAREGRVHRRRPPRAQRPLRAGRRRHPVPRRDRRAAASRPRRGCCACSQQRRVRRAVGGRTDQVRRPRRRRDASRSRADGRRRARSATICSTASTWCRCACRRCASGSTTSRPWSSISWSAHG